ncbi:DMT family transporter [Agrobacterium vitis]|uniref:DMT family transporter n=1 Tax=Agrobacterium vitis TaxID=373 RepID=A0A368NTN5_AGRVI|nr:DMT family transporter [Agrobacterium vitis]KAA3517496.1 DMT family transporter [Agrobacterium vitis]KAA3526897.1 DMT family transporter [Agrobacterium vitis]MCF1477088.1 DMT family transporter [Agrobacterium vitis]MUZ95728.1 EamA family transporter [Agrobacterium vitis]MVA30716.1 EamA family transporter [Agrobacterium vitis]
MQIRAYAYLVLTTLFWGGNAVAGKLAVGHISPMMLNLGRWSLALTLLLAVSSRQIKADWPVVRRHIPLLLALGAIGYTGFNGFLYSALKYTSAVNGAIEQGGIPVLIFLLNFLLFRIAASAIQIAGFLISFIGVALTAGHGDLMALLSLRLNFGDTLMLLAVLCYAIFTVALRWKPELHWKTLMAALAFGAALASLPLVAWEASNGSLIAPDATGWALILFCGLLPSLVSQTLYISGVNMIGANRAGLFINLVPVFGTILSVAVVGEKLEGFHMLALSLVIGGIALAEWGKPQTSTR